MAIRRGGPWALLLAAVGACAGEPREMTDLNGTWGHQRVFGIEEPPRCEERDLAHMVDPSQYHDNPR